MTNTYDNTYKSRWYNQYIECGNEKANEADAIEQELDYLTFYKNNETISVIDIGAGNGLLSKKIIDKLIKKFPQNRINYVAMDNSKELSELFLLNLSNYFTSAPPSCKITALTADYFSDEHNNKYDIVIAAHSMYRNDMNKSVRRIVNSLNKKGTAFIIRNNSGSIMSYLYDKYHVQNAANKIHPQKTFMCEDSMIKVLEEEQINYKMIGIPFSVKLPGDLKEFKKNIIENNGVVKKEHYNIADILSFIIDSPLDEIIKQKRFNEFISDLQNISADREIFSLNNLFIIKK